MLGVLGRGLEEVRGVSPPFSQLLRHLAEPAPVLWGNPGWCLSDLSCDVFCKQEPRGRNQWILPRCRQTCAPSGPQFPHMLSGSLRPLRREVNVPGITSLGPNQEKRDGQGQGPRLCPVLSHPHPASPPLANICCPHTAACCFLFLSSLQSCTWGRNSAPPP